MTPAWNMNTITTCNFFGLNGVRCLICHEDFVHDEILRKVVMCQHQFHHDCIKAWYNKSATCPICKQDLSKSEMEKYYKKLREDVYADEKASTLARRSVLAIDGPMKSDSKIGQTTEIREGGMSEDDGNNDSLKANGSFDEDVGQSV
jgi:hypothetical protein